jgi:hypothetical protein
MLALLHAVRHLRPPTACGPVRLDRFSPYYNAPVEFSLRNVRPIVAYQYLYPFDTEGLRETAYYFDYDYETGVDPSGYASEVIEYVEEWQREGETGTLRSINRPDGTIVLVDTRAGTLLQQLALSGLEQAAYDYCDEIRSTRSIVEHLRRSYPEIEFSDKQVSEFLDSLVANQLMATDGENYLSLAIREQTIESRTVYSQPEESSRRPAAGFLRAELKVLQPPL